MTIKLYTLSALGGVTGTSTAAAPILNSYATKYIDSKVKGIRESAEKTRIANEKIKRENQTLQNDKDRLQAQKDKEVELQKKAEQGRRVAEKQKNDAKTKKSNLENSNKQLELSQNNYLTATNIAKGELSKLQGDDKFNAIVEEETKKRFWNFTSLNKATLYPILEKQIKDKGDAITTSEIGWKCSNKTWIETNETRGVAYCILEPNSNGTSKNKIHKTSTRAKK